MLSAFRLETKVYDHTPDEALKDVNTIPAFLPNKRSDKTNVKRDIKSAIKRSNIPKDMLWVLK